ncbi:MAG: hypothetical protein LBS33_08225 [Streptococcaceae bacterium]|nr:hypothetical protein [Streptococcaceae bacterium]
MMAKMSKYKIELGRDIFWKFAFGLKADEIAEILQNTEWSEEWDEDKVLDILCDEVYADLGAVGYRVFIVAQEMIDYDLNGGESTRKERMDYVLERLTS